MNKVLLSLIVIFYSSTIFALSISAEEIRKPLKEHIPEFKSCYLQELDKAKEPDSFKASVNLKFTIGKAGKVTKSTVTSEEITSDKVRDCIKNVLQGIQFAIPENGKVVDVNQNMKIH